MKLDKKELQNFLKNEWRIYASDKTAKLEANMTSCFRVSHKEIITYEGSNIDLAIECFNNKYLLVRNGYVYEKCGPFQAINVRAIHSIDNGVSWKHIVAYIVGDTPNAYLPKHLFYNVIRSI